MNATPIIQINTPASLDTTASYQRIMVTHAGTGMSTYAVHSTWDATTQYVKRMSGVCARPNKRSRGVKVSELKAVCQRVAAEKADVVVIVGQRTKRHMGNFFFNDPATMIHQMTQLPVVNIKG